MKTFINPVSNPTELKEVVAALKEGKTHPVLAEAGMYMFWGATTYALYNGTRADPIALIQMKLGKRRKNVWEPYANWYGAYTREAYRRQGHATRLYRVLEQLAVDAGCRRVKSLAGSSAGLGLHASLGHQCWGLTLTGEVFVDSPLPGSEHFYTSDMKPAQAPGWPMSPKGIEHTIKGGLRYDRQ